MKRRIGILCVLLLAGWVCDLTAIGSDSLEPFQETHGVIAPASGAGEGKVFLERAARELQWSIAGHFRRSFMHAVSSIFARLPVYLLAISPQPAFPGSAMLPRAPTSAVNS